MIQYYDALLDVYSQIKDWQKYQLDDLNNSAKIMFSEKKSWKDSTLSELREEFFKNLTEKKNKYTETLAEIEGLLSFEDFKKLPVEKQNTKKAIQNRIIDLMQDLLLDESNIRQMLTPNSTNTIKPLADKIKELKGEKNNETDMTALSEFATMSRIREAYTTGKKLVGITALQITSHTVSQLSLIHI